MEDLTITRSVSLLTQLLIIIKGPSSKSEKHFLKVLLVQAVLPAAESISRLWRLSPCLSFPAFPTFCDFSLPDPLHLTGIPDSPGTVCYGAFIS